MDLKNTTILVKKLNSKCGSRFKLHKQGDVGFDIEFFGENKEVAIPPFSFCELSSGLKIKVGDNCWGMIRPRSYAVFKKRLIIMEGTIDSGYTGELFVLVYNPNNYVVHVAEGEALAQLVPVPKFIDVEIVHVDKFPETERGESGFGSTGGIKYDETEKALQGHGRIQ